MQKICVADSPAFHCIRAFWEPLLLCTSKKISVAFLKLGMSSTKPLAYLTLHSCGCDKASRAYG
ncbi:hypothetical protein RchiOBHm_Chr4g0411001 [Rosa chinensis]|uniref:Uncharacterized protein n=1 Tax=Rosa chinensis TaxID=74649 RepID=A0A2P6QVH2_ROSCH|nr:hypothetical protein RchiOBHm_Chr4g0411001 [Rosa chinensis]